MAVVTKTATKRGPSRGGTHGLSGAVHVLNGTVEVGSVDSSGSTYQFFRIPSEARILGTSSIWADDLSSTATGLPTLDIGLFAVDGNITSDPDALNDGLAASAAITTTAVVKDIANYGKRAWEFVNGQTTDPGGLLDVKVSLVDADVNAGGTVSMELSFLTD